jgi:hypothetical protein
MAPSGGALHSAFAARWGVDACKRSQVRRSETRDARAHDISTPAVMKTSTIAPRLYVKSSQTRCHATHWAQGVASFRTPYLQTISRRRPLVELERGMQRPPARARQCRGRHKGVASTGNRYQTRRLVSDGCQSGRSGTPGKRVYRKVPRVRIPPHPPFQNRTANALVSPMQSEFRLLPLS